MSTGIRRFWHCYFGIVALYMASSIGIAFGPAIEAHFYPVRVDQSVDAVARTGDGALCWDWSGNKVRKLASDNVDVYVRVNGGERAVTSVYRADTGEFWKASAAPGLGPVLTRYCTRLPPSISVTDAVRVEWLAWYPSGTGMWRFSTELPGVESPGVAAPVTP